MLAGLHQTIAELRAENDELREELRAIREQAPPEYEVRQRLGIRLGLARVVCAFLRGAGYLPFDAVLAAASPDPDAVSDPRERVCVEICQLRRALKPHGIKIATYWGGGGFHISPDHLERLRRLIDSSTTPMAGDPMCTHSPATSGATGRAGRSDAPHVLTAPPVAHAPKSQGG